MNNRYITLVNDIVTSVRFAATPVLGEIASSVGEIGQIQQADGSFITPIPTPVIPALTLEDLNDNQLVIMNAIADLYSALPVTTTT